MLNPSFPKQVCANLTKPYVAPDSIVNRTIQGNSAFDTGNEHRLQSAFGDELWLKLERAGFTPEVLSGLSVLEVCSGTGFLSFHLLERCNPKSFTVNDISSSEMTAAQQLTKHHYPAAKIEWVLGDMHTVNFEHKFDLIIGNSFIHHFYNVPQALARFCDLLNPGGTFITLHEPTPMSTIVEGSKILAYPLAVLAPVMVNNIARSRFKGGPSQTDLWLFEPRLLKKVALLSGFKYVDVQSWGLFRPIVVKLFGLNLSANKPKLTEREASIFIKAVKVDAFLSRFLPKRCFGSICVACRK